MYKITLKPQPKGDGTHSIVLRVTSKGSRNTKRIDKRITLTELPSVRPEQWNSDAGVYRKNFTGYKTANKQLKMIEDKCDNVQKELKREGRLSVQYFIDRFLERSKAITKVTVADALLYKINHFEKQGSWGSRKVYAGTLRRWNAYLRYKGKRQVSLTDLTTLELKEFIGFLETGKGEGGVLHRMRDLRSSFNDAIKFGLIPKMDSPFDNIDFKAFRSKRKNAQKPLEAEEWLLFKSYSSENKERMFWKDIFIFMVNAQGTNIKDLISLKYDNIIDARTPAGPIKVIRYKRRKTMRKRPDATIDIVVTNTISELIEKYRSEDSPYLFNLLSTYEFKENSKEWEHQCKNTTHRFNYHLEKICEELGFKKKVSNYAARHTFATLLFWDDTPIHVISQALGHSDVTTTNTYLSNLNLVALSEYLIKNKSL